MPDFLVTLISTLGALVGAIGGVWLTNRDSVRREEAQFTRQRHDQQTQARREAYAQLLDTATQLKAEIQVAGQRRHWKDMNARLTTIQRHAVSAGPHAERVALLALTPETAKAARALASAAVDLAAAATKHTVVGEDGGEIQQACDFTKFDECFDTFSHATTQDPKE